MNDVFFINDCSLPAQNKNDAKKYMTSIFQGVINLTEGNYPVLFCDNNIDTLKLSSDFFIFRLSKNYGRGKHRFC